jgi:hypothetical protein
MVILLPWRALAIYQAGLRIGERTSATRVRRQVARQQIANIFNVIQRCRGRMKGEDRNCLQLA